MLEDCFDGDAYPLVAVPFFPQQLAWMADSPGPGELDNIAGTEEPGWLHGISADAHMSSGTGPSGGRTRPAEPHGPEPFICADGFVCHTGNGGFLSEIRMDCTGKCARTPVF